MVYDLTHCTLCPRKCGADRTKGKGFCGGGMLPRIAKAYLHMWEEPCICGDRGAGTIFFSGCSLRCVYCQNYKISAENYGAEISVERLADIFIELQDKGAACIEAVSASHYVPQLIAALDIARPKLNIPVVFNCGGYEDTDTLRMLSGYIDIYLPDLKYNSPEAAARYSSAPDYPMIAGNALKEMCRQTGGCVFEGEYMKKGVIVRHLILPKLYRDSIEILKFLSSLPRDSFRLSLMSQYTPFYKSSEYPEIDRRIYTYEYERVLEAAQKLGLEGYMQERSSAKEEYTPAFDLSGVFPE